MEYFQKVLLINGSPNEKGCTYTALNEIAKVLDRHGIESKILYLGKQPVAGCIACSHCKRSQDHLCVFDDLVNKVLSHSDEYGAIVVGSPVYYASASGQLIAFLDRLFHSSCGRLSGKLGASVVSCRRGGATVTFDELNKYFSISNMPIVTSQYWNMVHGRKPEDVMQDEEGLQTMRTLGENIAWLMSCIAAGRKAGVPSPAYEKQIATDYIR